MQIKNKLKANAKPLTELGFSAAVYCALFHEAKRGLKLGVRHLARSRRCVKAIVRLRRHLPGSQHLARQCNAHVMARWAGTK